MVIANFEQGETSKKVRGLKQWDYGQVLRIQGLHLPTAVEIHFSLQENRGDCINRIGVTKDGVTDVVIPDSMVENEGAIGQEYYIYAWVYLTDETSGHTEYEIKLSVETRSKPEAFDKPEDAELFREAIKAVNECADRAVEAAKKEVTDGRIDEAVTEYLDENGIKTDKTLTVDGGIADAKATGEALDKKASINNAVFTGSISLGRKEGSTVGVGSVAIGDNVEASGKYSYAEGSYNTASGESSHAEGAGTTASGKYSHAECYCTTASGERSHAEGQDTKASEWCSHAEGQDTKASGWCSHAEGKDTKASGYGSHAEGDRTTASGQSSHAEGFGTKSIQDCQHVQGRFNIEDTENKYAHIVGNGGSEGYRSNAHTVDWKGNAWYAGKLTQEGAPTEEKDLATKKYVDDQKPFVAEYNVTTFAEIQNEYNSKKVVLCTNEGLVTKLDILAPDNYAQFSGLDDKGNPALLKVTKDNEWTRKNVMHTTPNYVDSLFNTANTNITSLKTSVDDIGRYINGKDPMLSALSNMNTVDILKSVYRFRGGFCDNAGTLHIKKPGIYLVLQGGKENKQIIINQNGTEVLNETWNGIIIMAYDNGVITPIGIAASLTIAGAFKMPGTFQGWTNDGSCSTTINYPAQCVISYLGNSNVDYLE